MNLPFSNISEIVIATESHPTESTVLAYSELRRGLRRLTRKISVQDDKSASEGSLLFTLQAAGTAAGSNVESYTIAYHDSSPPRLAINAASEQSLLYAVFDFLERQGVVFGLDGELYPMDSPTHLCLPESDSPWSGIPRFASRGLQPWPDFLNCITIFNEEDLRAYLEAMLRMRLNTLGIHVYGQSQKWAEPFLSFEYGGVGHAAFADTTATDRWGYLPQRTSRYGMSAPQYFDDEIFGADATRYAAGPWETAERSQRLWQSMFNYAAELGIKMGIGFELYQLPEEIVKAVPAQVRATVEHSIATDSGATYTFSFNRVDPTSRAAKYILETRLAHLLETYPTVSYIQLWEDEFTNWTSQKRAIETPIEPIMQAHDFLRRHAPDKRLVVAGWGGVVRNFPRFHRELPADIIFSALSDQFGWDPIHENFGALDDRERWPIPWLEDDPSMWFPQLHVSRFEKDLQRAEDLACTGMIGIHWRHRIVDPVATYMARRSWDDSYTTKAHYHAYAKTQASGERAAAFGNWLHDTDVNRKLVETWTGNIRDDGHYQSQEFSGDYGEVFLHGVGDVDDATLATLDETIADLQRIASDIPPETCEGENLGYWTGQVGFMSPYLHAWRAGRKLEKLLDSLFAQRNDGEEPDIAVVHEQAIPLWIEVLRYTREAVLRFQRTVATRNDLGMLASIHNKFVRIATFRLKASILEFIDEIPPDAQQALDTAVAPDTDNIASLIVPTRPTRLRPGQSIRISAIAPGTAELTHIAIHYRGIGAPGWQSIAMTHIGRRTWGADLTMPIDFADGIEYHIRAEFGATPQPITRRCPRQGNYIVSK